MACTNYSLRKIPVNCRYAIRGPFKSSKNRVFRAVICGFVSQSYAEPAQNLGKVPTQSTPTVPGGIFIWNWIGFQFE